MLSSTYEIDDIKAELESYSFYNYDTENDFETAITTAIKNAMYKDMLPAIGWSVYGTVRNYDRNFFDDDTCDITDGSTTVTMDSTSSLAVDMYVNGFGVTTGTQVDSITDSTTFELTQAATEDGTDIVLTFSKMTDTEYYVYLAEVDFAIADFLRHHGRQQLFARKAASESISEGNITRTTSGLIGPKMAARDYEERAKWNLQRAGYLAPLAIERGNFVDRWA